MLNVPLLAVTGFPDCNSPLSLSVLGACRSGVVEKKTLSIVFYPPWVICTVVSQIWFYDKLFISNNFLELLAFWGFAGVLEFEIGSQEGLICLGKQRTICHWWNNYIPAIGSDSWIAAITQTGGLSDAWVFQRDSRRRTIKEDKDSILCVLLLLLHGRVSC